MQRLTFSVDDDLAEDFERLLKARHYKNRSEAFRDLVRREIASDVAESGNGECVAVVAYAFDHKTRVACDLKHACALKSRQVCRSCCDARKDASSAPLSGNDDCRDRR